MKASDKIAICQPTSQLSFLMHLLTCLDLETTKTKNPQDQDRENAVSRWYSVSSSDVVLEADASPQGRKFWCLGLMPAAPVFHWLASVSPLLIWLMGKPHKTQMLVMG